MKKSILYSLIHFLVFITTINLLHPCTGVRLIAENGAVVYGRTLEFGKNIESKVIIIPRNYAFVGTLPLGMPGMQWQSKYAVAGANAFDAVTVVDGVNEKGLAGGLFYFSGYAEYQEVTPEEYGNALAPHELLTWILTNFSTVKEVKEALPHIKVAKTVFPPLGIVPPLHAIVHDEQGASMVIEYVQGKLVLYDNKLGVITNAPTFDWHMTNLKNYVMLSARNNAPLVLKNLKLEPLSQGSGMLGLPGDFTSSSRFVRAVAFSQSVLMSKDETEARHAVFHILNLFDIPRGVVYQDVPGSRVYDFTQWTGVSDLRNKQYYFTTYGNAQVHKIDLMAMDLTTSDAIMVPMKYEQKIVDITPRNSIVEEIDQDSFFDKIVNAYIYAYPLVVTEITKQVMTQSSAQHKDPMKPTAPVNSFAHMSVFPTDEFTGIVRPNVDTLYSSAWLDLSQEPIVLSVPDTHGRYYLMEVMDAWTNVFASLGARTTGTKARDFVFVGPTWRGKLPEGMEVIQAPTSLVWILGRTQTNGKNDYEHVHTLQAGYKLTPLNIWKKPRSKSVAIPSTHKETWQGAPVDVVAALHAQEFFTLFAQALQHNAAPENTAYDEAVASLKKIQGSSLKKANEALLVAQKKIAQEANNLGKKMDGWHVALDVGTYGTDYLKRAAVAFIGIGANLPEDAVYPIAYTDADGNPLNGAYAYKIHFDKKDFPPVNAFWSITMYDPRSFLVPNSLGRYALRDRDPVHYNKDGSLDIFIQHRSPGGNKEANWLPAPQGDFNLTLRMYWPEQAVLDGTWLPPKIERMPAYA